MTAFNKNKAPEIGTGEDVLDKDLEFDFENAPTPNATGMLTIDVTADLGSSFEFLEVRAEGMFSENVFATGGGELTPSTTMLAIPLATLVNAILRAWPAQKQVAM